MTSRNAAAAWLAHVAVLAPSLCGCFGSSSPSSGPDAAEPDGTLPCPACDAEAPDAPGDAGAGADASGDASAEGATSDASLPAFDASACVDSGAGGCLLVIADNQGNATSVHVDATSVYWVQEASGAIMKAPLGGGTAATIAVGGGGTFFMALDATRVYFANEYTGVVSSAPLDGDGGSVTVLATGQSTPEALAVDGTGLYWANLNAGTVVTSPLGGVPDGGSPTVIASGLTSPVALTLDGTHVYFATGDGAVRSAPKTAIDGGAGTVLAAGQNATGIAVDSSRIYWTNGDASGALLAAPLTGLPDGGAPTTLASPLSAAAGVTVDSTTAYVAAGGNPGGFVASVPLAGGAVTTLATGQTSPGPVALDVSGDVYWANFAFGKVLELVP